MTEKRRMDNEKEPDENLIFGRNAVAELLKSGRTVDKVLIQRGQREGSITTIAATAKKLGVPVIDAEKQVFHQLTERLADIPTSAGHIRNPELLCDTVDVQILRVQKQMIRIEQIIIESAK